MSLSRLQDSARQGRADPAALAALAAQIESSAGRRRARLAALPPITYPEELPVSERRGEIARAIAAHQVVIVCGETGSGKTTQLPKICLELKRGVGRHDRAHAAATHRGAHGGGAHRRRSWARRSGEQVGFRVRFSDRVSDDNFLRVMTDGILLAETQTDRFLNAYDTIIIDEAHERSLNIDFLLGYVKRLLPRRPELKLIITSATIDAQRFSEHFDDAPVIEVSGRLYPVEMRYRPIEAGRGRQARSICPKRSSMRWTMSRACPRAATSWCSCPASARSARPPRRCASIIPSTPRSCRCSRACLRRSRSRCSSPAGRAASCSPPTSPRPR